MTYRSRDRQKEEYMTSRGRTKLICTKWLKNGIFEKFEVWTTSDRVSKLKGDYKSRGYKVHEVGSDS